MVAAAPGAPEGLGAAPWVWSAAAPHWRQKREPSVIWVPHWLQNIRVSPFAWAEPPRPFQPRSLDDSPRDGNDFAAQAEMTACPRRSTHLPMEPGDSRSQ